MTQVLRRLQVAAVRLELELTEKACDELAALSLSVVDACHVIACLTETDFHHRVRSRRGGAPLYVFKPVVAGLRLYIKLVAREAFVVVSFHEDGEEEAHGSH